jgi:hypothetical protein
MKLKKKLTKKIKVDWVVGGWNWKKKSIIKEPKKINKVNPAKLVKPATRIIRSR